MRNDGVAVVSRPAFPPGSERAVNSHFLLQVSSMQFGLDGRIDEPLVPIPRRRRWGRRAGPAALPIGDDPGATLGAAADGPGAAPADRRPADSESGVPVVTGRADTAAADRGGRG